MNPMANDKPLLGRNIPGPFTITIDNLTGGDIVFLSQLTALFCDPAKADKLASLRAGRSGIYRDPVTSEALISDIFTPPNPQQKRN